MAISYTEFLAEVSPYAPDVSEPAALNAIRNACIDFCEKTTIWRASVSIVVVAGQNTYTVPAVADAEVASVLSAYYDGRQLVPTSEDMLNALNYLEWRTAEGTPTAFVMDPAAGGRTLVLSRVPGTVDDGKILSLRYALRPSRASESIGLDYVHDRWLETIAHGALARLYQTMGQPYYNPQVGAVYALQFAAGKGKAQAEVNAGNGRGQLRVAAVPFVRGRSTWR